MGRPLGLVSVALEDEWSERSLIIVTRDSARLSPVARLLFDHLSSVEALSGKA
jgi:hypothetical protein